MIRPDSFTLGPALFCRDLSPAAKSIEESAAFKRASQTVFERAFGPMTAAFGTPFLGMDAPAVPLQFSDAGHAEDTELRAFATDHLARFDQSGQAWSLGEEVMGLCLPSPTGWIIVHGYALGSGLDLPTEIVAQYDKDGGTLSSSAVRSELEALPIALLVQWVARI